MRGFAVLALVVGACYDPHPVPGAPCGEADPACPPGQECVFGVCNSVGNHTTDPDGTTHGSDGSTDPLIDPDGDGVDSAVDNCPSIANANQANEDGDKFGDACDPCPIDASDTPVDSDGDGVADPCDPHPGVAGDHLVVFEGFADGIPSSWEAIGTATAANGEVTLTTVANNHTALVAPGAPLGNATITASLIVDMQLGSFESSTTLSLPYSSSDDNGIFCELYAPMASSPNGRYLSIWDSPAQAERGAANLAWTTGVAYKVSLMHTGNNYSCSAGGKTTNGSTGSSVPAGMAAVAVYGANARAQWVMVVTSP